MGHEALETRVRDRPHDRGIVQFLRVVDLGPPRDPAGVVVADPGARVRQRADDVPFHDLHVVDVVEDLHAGRVDGPDDLERVVHAVADVVDVSAGFRVEDLDEDRDVLGFGDGGARLEAADRVLDADAVLHPAAVAEEADDVGDRDARGVRDVALEGLDDARMVFSLVEAVLDRPGRHVAARDRETVVVRDGPFLDREQVHRGEAHVGHALAEGDERDLLEAPAGHGLRDGVGGVAGGSVAPRRRGLASEGRCGVCSAGDEETEGGGARRAQGIAACDRPGVAAADRPFVAGPGPVSHRTTRGARSSRAPTPSDRRARRARRSSG